MSTYGYARVSTSKQDITRQKRNILAVDSSAKIYEEVFTGTKTTGRIEFNKLLQRIQPGDTIIFDSVSRMSRNAAEGFDLYKELYEKDISLVFINEPYINTSVYRDTSERLVPMTGTDVDLILSGVNEYLMKLAEEQVKIAFDQAQKERDDLSERTKQGLITAKLNGKRLGRQAGSKVVTRKSDECIKKILQYSKSFGGSLPDTELIKMLGINRNTFYKYKKQVMEELQS